MRILFTRNAIYFGIYCYDSDPSDIVATELRRDVSEDLDDHFEIMINANHDRRSGHVFEVNPLGTQADGLIVEEQSGSEGTDFDSGWDGVWKSEARVAEDGQPPAFPLTGGVDIKYGINSKMLLNLTGNTDFSATDVDQEQFNLTPFPIFVPEKRQFFLENAGVFNFELGDQDQLFFSRQIGIDSVTGEQVP